MRITAVLASACLGVLVPTALPGQSATFQAIAWGSSVESVTQRLRALGYGQEDPPEAGNIYWGNDAEFVFAQFGPRGLYYLQRNTSTEAAEASPLFASLRDSVQSAMGRRADSLRADRAVWITSSGRVALERVFPTVERTWDGVVISHYSPRYEQEREAAIEQFMREYIDVQREWFRSRVDRERWGVVYAADSFAVSFDRRNVSRPSPGVIRLWIRYDHRAPQLRTAYPRERYSHTLSHTEIRCRPMAIRSQATYWYLDSRVVHSANYETFGDWENVIPSTVGETMAEEVCRLLSR
jgi:hypothetical protein